MALWYLIHGAASSRLIWTRQMPILRGAKRAELPILDDVPEVRLINAWADWCLEQLTQPAVIMGHSMGGAIAQTMALKAPELVEGLVLVGTGPHLPVNPALIQSLLDTPREALERITRWSLAKNPDPDLLQKSLEQARSVDTHEAWRQFVACTAFDVRSDLRRITCPKAIIAGAEDRMTPESLTRSFLDAWPDAPYHQISGAGHSMMLEQPEIFNDILLDLMEKFNW
ncbi:alpha/beta fold hydrolase [Sulfobacillus harzensis]|uniref:Alpha/beta hydrolase n=1 Tax=Sulfobacillus harzensis TaxID=2729629 RepID=A0A7Y0L6I4_9FIRM|nr:alpha/beta hydrolase [Sulfobacillus harzensis]NMP22839.1 alpha/beta hydrolase [Sulfobacillus harzensis]